MKIIKIDINKTPKRVPIKLTQKEDTPFILALDCDDITTNLIYEKLNEKIDGLTQFRFQSINNEGEYLIETCDGKKIIIKIKKSDIVYDSRIDEIKALSGDLGDLTEEVVEIGADLEDLEEDYLQNKYWDLLITHDTTIPDGAYRGAYNLRSITSPNYLKIYAGCFDDAPNLLSLDFKSASINGNYLANTKITDVRLTYWTFIQRYGASNLSSLNMPDGTNVTDSTFRDYLKLKQINIPKCTSFATSAFRDAHNLSSITAPLLSTMGQFCICGTSIYEADFPNLEKESGYNFQNLSNLSSINAPLLSNGMGVENCPQLSSLDLPSLKTGTILIRYCANLTSVNIPLFAGQVADNGIKNCPKILSLDLRGVTGFMPSSIRAMANLGILKLRDLTTFSSNQFLECPKLSLDFSDDGSEDGKSSEDVVAITNFSYIPNNLVVTCSDGRFKKSGSTLVPIN